MANIKQQKKRIRTAERQRLENLRYKSTTKTLFRRLEAAVNASETDVAQATHKELTSLIDRACTKNVFHSNTAARKKARAARMLIAEPVKETKATRRPKKKAAPRTAKAATAKTTKAAEAKAAASTEATAADATAAVATEDAPAAEVKKPAAKKPVAKKPAADKKDAAEKKPAAKKPAAKKDETQAADDAPATE
jgi:ribosomal protein S20